MVALGAEVRVIANRMPEEGSIPGLPRSAVGTHGECFSAFAAGADLIALCCSQNSANIGMVDEAFLRQCKEGVMLVNVARVSALNTQHIYSFQLLTSSNQILGPGRAPKLPGCMEWLREWACGRIGN